MQYPIIDLITDAYINNGWTGLDIPQTITYEPIQLGSGDPSPDNIRPIFPSTTLNIGGNDVPIYGGTLDVATKSLTINKVKEIVSPNTIIARQLGRDNIHYFNIVPSITISDVNLCNMLIEETFTSVWRGNNGFADREATQPYYSIFIDTLKESEMDEAKAYLIDNGFEIIVTLATPENYQLTDNEFYEAIGIKDDIAHRLKLPLPHYFPHPVIDALQRAASGTQTADDTEILQHYLTPLGIGGI